MSSYSTRQKSGNAVIGPSAELPQSDLPTLRDVLAYGCLLKEKSLLSKNSFSDKDLTEQVCSDIKKVWTRVNHKIVVPGVISLDKNIEKKILTGWKMMGTVKSKRANKKKEEEWIKTLDKAFNILICHCQFKLCSEYGCKGCSASIHLSCTCPAIARIPAMEVPFFHSQLSKVGTKGSIRIGTVDKVESLKQTKALVRANKKKAAAAKKQAKQNEGKAMEDNRKSEFESTCNEVDENENYDEDKEFTSKATEKLVKQSKQNRLNLTNMARVSLTCDVSISATAQIGTALLIDLG